MAIAIVLSLAEPSGLSAGVVGITLVAAVLHAVWNAVAHGISDRFVGFALIGLAYVGAGGVAALVLGPPPARAWPSTAVAPPARGWAPPRRPASASPDRCCGTGRRPSPRLRSRCPGLVTVPVEDREPSRLVLARRRAGSTPQVESFAQIAAETYRRSPG